MDLPALVMSARRELGLPLAAPTPRPVASIAPGDQPDASRTLAGDPRSLPSTAPAAAPAAELPTGRQDSVSASMRALGGTLRRASQALADIANGTATVLAPDAVAARRADRPAARALLSSMFLDAVRHGESSMPRAPRTDGNRVDLLVRNEQYVPRLYDDLARAQRSITINQFNWEPDGSGAHVADVLEQKARAGVDVRVLVDGYGIKERGGDVADALQQRLERAGVRFERTGGFRLGGSGFEHRKLITIDDRVAYTGGLGFGAKYDTWTDLMVRIEGPAAAVAAADALATHTEHQGEVDPALDTRIRSLHASLQDAARGARTLAATAPTSGPLADASAAVTLLDNRPGADLASSEAFLRDVHDARKRFWATSTYLTTPVAADALADAARRGVDVKLLMTGPTAGNDGKQVLLSRSLYGRMLDAGVEVYEHSGMLHSKSWLKDDDVAAVGSMNLSRSSMSRAREITARVEDPAFADRYASFHADARTGATLVSRDDVGGIGVKLASLLGPLGLEF